MLADLFAPANLMTTLTVLAALVLAGICQYRLCLVQVPLWLRWLPVIVCGGGAVLCIVLIFAAQDPWHALSWIFYFLFALALLISCTIGCMFANHKKKKAQARKKHPQT